MIIATDYDGTIACQSPGRTVCKIWHWGGDPWPNVGEPCWPTIIFLRQARDDGHKVILWTTRDGLILKEAINACRKWGLEFDAVNENLPERIAKYGNDSRKVSADIYLDDRAFTPELLTRLHRIKEQEGYPRPSAPSVEKENPNGN